MIENKYEDIINLPYPNENTRPKMSMHDRAAQFSPFAALTGYEEAVEETARLTDDKIELAEDIKAIIDAKLQMLADRIDEMPTVTVLCFVADEKKAGGKYVTVTDRVKSIDPIERLFVTCRKGSIPIENIRSIEGDIFVGWE